MIKTVPSQRTAYLLPLLLMWLSLLSGCVVAGRGRQAPSQEQLAHEFDIYRSLIYAQAPELRGEPLVFTDGGSSGEHLLITSVQDVRDMQYLRARFRFERDTGSVYRFVDYERRRDDPSKPPKITLTIGRERATHVIEEQHHKTTPDA